MTADSSSHNFSIFVSCRKEDKPEALTIGEQLEVIGRPRIKVHVSDVLPAGKGKRKEELMNLSSADRLILLFTDPRQDWSSCFYESGFFDGKGFSDSENRLVVLHGPNCQPPAPLSSFNTVDISDAVELNRFLCQLFESPPGKGLPPINPEIMQPAFEANRKPLLDAIRTAVFGENPRYEAFGKELRIEVPHTPLGNLDVATIYGIASVFGDLETSKIFNVRYRSEGYPWIKFLEAIKKAPDSNTKLVDDADSWMGALANMMVLIAATDEPTASTGLPLFRSRDREVPYDDRKVYRPTVLDYASRKGRHTFRELFCDLPAEITDEPRGVLTTLAQALTAGRMFRWGVLVPLLKSLAERGTLLSAGSITSAEWADAAVRNFEQFYERTSTVMAESLNRGYDRDELFNCFTGAERDEIEELLKEWDGFFGETLALIQRLRAKEPVISELPIKLAQHALDLNKKFMIICSGRFGRGMRDL